MRCIFCKENSINSKSIEHVIPESLGGKKILPAGVVCDKCNNYFARKIEKPFLDDYSMILLRFEQSIENKKGIIPTVDGILNQHYAVKVWKDMNSGFAGHIDVDQHSLKSIFSTTKNKIIFPMATDDKFLKSGSTVSRFIGKIAIESFAQRIFESKYSDTLDLFIDDIQYDPLRNHVRRGTQKEWSCNVRRIYNINKKWVNPQTHENYQVMNEYDFLITEKSELYFVFVLLGREYTINMGGSDVEGYKEWLDINNHKSPLYFGKNSLEY